jgi:hypothetical protein
MKGVMLRINPLARLVDITHDLEPFAVLEGAMVLKGMVPYFPKGTIHVAVVDPGVGSNRRGIILRAEDRTFVGPDNGLFSLVLPKDEACEIREIQNDDYVLSEPHPSFHGRDIFAPAAAHLSAGKAFEEVGPIVDDPTVLSLPAVKGTGDGLEGAVIYVDRFGNLASNIDRMMLTREVATVRVGNSNIRGISRYFAEVGEGDALALINSFGLLEIAVYRGDASEILGIGKGEPVRVFWV